jgi:hypothetical protein
VRAPRWWPFELVTDRASSTSNCLIVRLPRGRELFVWFERRLPRAMYKNWWKEQ